MSNANPIPTPDTLVRQVGRWLALHMGVNAAGEYLAGGFPRGVGFVDAELPDAGRVFTGREMIWGRALPEISDRSASTGGVWMGLTAEAVPSPSGGVDVPSRVIGVRVWVEALTRVQGLEVLADVARVFALPGYSQSGRRFVYAQAGVSAAALEAVGGSMLGLIGVPPPESIGENGVALWRVVAVEEYAPAQVVSDEIAAAQTGGVPGASGTVACAMTLAFTVVPATIAAPTLAFRAWLPVTEGDDAALRVARFTNGEVCIGEAIYEPEGTHHYAWFQAATVADVIAAMGNNGWEFGAVQEGVGARPASDLVLMDWRRGRKTAGQQTIEATVYVHGAVTIEKGGGE